MLLGLASGSGFNWQEATTAGVVAGVFLLLIFTQLGPEFILIGGLAVLLLTGIVTPDQALSGFANEGMITVGVLFVVGAGVRETGAVTWIAERILGRPKTTARAITRLTVPVTIGSAVMNNTPLVAMMIPATADWAKQLRIPVSKLMIPLSYAAILGGTCTLIGTSTNLVVAGLVEESKALPPLGMLDITWVGLPAALAGLAFILLFSRWLLPDRSSVISQLTDPKEYTIEMLVAPDSGLVGRSIEEAGLRHLQGVFLAEIDRDGMILPAVGPQERLRGNDRLVFVGIVDSVIDLQKVRGLLPATDQVFKLDRPRNERCLIEAVVSQSCPVTGKTIRDGRFRSLYNAAVIAVARNGERLRQKIGDIVLRPGDSLLLEAAPSFVDQHRNSRDFFLVSQLANSNPPKHERTVAALLILLAMVVLMTSNLLSPLKAALVASFLMLITRCCTPRAAARSIDFGVLLAIGASFGIGTALEVTGVAKTLAESMTGLAGGHAWATLALVYAVTLIVTELITNNAAAALMFPLCIATATRLEANPMPFVVAVMMAASAGFATPIGYQTNLMVYGPGGYRFSDYVKIGLPLDILVGVVTVALAPLVWPFFSS
ncbi:MAG: SLC13 family permease [Planctomycetaceae bacterium]|nr:SLC13 family permease [Planctomycetaceae bacterium]